MGKNKHQIKVNGFSQITLSRTKKLVQADLVDIQIKPYIYLLSWIDDSRNKRTIDLISIGVIHHAHCLALACVADYSVALANSFTSVCPGHTQVI